MARKLLTRPRLPLTQQITGSSVLASNTVNAGAFNGNFGIGSGSRLASAADGWVGSESYGWWMTRATFGGGSGYVAYETVDGRKCLTIEGKGLFKSGASTSLFGVVNVDQYPGATLTGTAQKYLIPVTAGDVIRISFKVFIHYNNVPGKIVARIGPTCYNTSLARSTPSYSWTDVQTIGQWVDVVEQFTVSAGCSYLTIAPILASNPGAADFTANDAKASFTDIRVEKVLSVTNSGAYSSPYLPTIQGVASVDNVDQNLDPTGAYANTYTPLTSVNEGATHRQTFTPTRDNCSRIGVFIVSKGTGRMRIVVHDSSNNSVGGSIDPNTGILNSNLVDGQFNYFGIAGKFVVGQTYHFHILSTVADGTIASNVANDCEACSFIECFSKKTDEVLIRDSSGNALDVVADQEGLPHNAMIDFASRRFVLRDRYVQGGLDDSWIYNYVDMYEYGGYGANLYTGIANGLMVHQSGAYVTKRINTIYPMKTVNLRMVAVVAATRSAKYQYSWDNVNWTDIATIDNTLSGKNQYLNITPPAGQTVIYLKWAGISQTCYLTELDFEAELDLAGISPLMLAPGANTLYFSSPSVIDNANRSPSHKTVISKAIIPITAASASHRVQATKRKQLYTNPSALSFNGVDSYVQITPNGTPSILDFSGDYTYSLKFLLTAITGVRQTLFNSNPASNNRQGLQISTDGYLMFGRYNGSAYQGKKSNAPISLNVWHHVVIRCVGGVFTMNLDDVAQTLTDVSTVQTDGSGFRIGLRPGGVQPFGGMIDDFRAWSRGLLDAELTKINLPHIISRNSLELELLMDETSGSTAIDSSGQGRNGTVSNAVYTTALDVKARTQVT